MIEIDDIRDDEFRVLGRPKNDMPAPVDYNSHRRNNAVGVVSAIIVVAIGILAIVFWPTKIPDKPEIGVYDSPPSSPQPPNEISQKPLLLGTKTESSFTEKIDTVINDIPLSLYLPHNAIPELMVGRPDNNDKDIILIAQAADIRGDNYKILGAFVLKGKPLAWGLSKKGYCAIIDGDITVGTSDNSPLFEKATETGGYFFRQFPLVNNGVLEENEQRNKTIRKALCSRNGQVFIAVTGTRESFHDFAQSLVDFGVENAINLVGSNSAFGWYIDSNNEQTVFGEDIHKYKNENYILWKSVGEQ